MQRYTHEQILALLPERTAPESAPAPKADAGPGDTGRAGDAAVAGLDPGTYLERHGWSYISTDPDGTRYYAGPHKDATEGNSTTVFPDGQVFNWSSTASQMTGIPHGPTRRAQGLPGSVDVFGLVAHMEHGGDFSAARRALTSAGFGDEPAPEVPWQEWVADARRRAGKLENTHPGGGENSRTPETIADQLRAKLLRGRAILDVQAKEPLIDGWLDVGDFGVLYGPPGAGKSFTTIDMACSVALGRPWQGHAVRQGPVLYIVAEGAQGVPGRFLAWEALNGAEVGDELAWLPMRINLRSREWSRGVAEMAMDLDPVLIVVDTLNRTFDGGNENDSADMGAYIAGIDDMRELTGATVLVVHHSGKDMAAGGRGHSSLLGAVDAELALKPTGKRRFTLESTKQKDKEQEAPTSFKLVPAGPRDSEGRQSVAVQLDESPDAVSAEAGGQLVAVLEALAEVATQDGASTSVWRENALDRGAISSERTFYRAMKRLEELGALHRFGGQQGRWAPRQSVLSNPDLLLNPDPNKAEIDPAERVD